MKTKTIKKIISIVLSLIAALTVFAFAGCDFFKKDYYPEYESGYYRYAVKTEDDGTKKAYLVGFTELGQEQDELIYPDELDGIKVYGIGYDLPHVIGTQPVGSFKSGNLKKFYFPGPIWQSSYSYLHLPNCDIIVWHTKSGAFGRYLHKESDTFSYNTKIYGYNLLNRELNDLIHCLSPEDRYVANVSYMCNYESAPNDGYYWVDSYNETVISFIPPQPEREGYEFGGWYKEPECENEWNFETDSVGKSIKIDKEQIRKLQNNELEISDIELEVSEQITNLYAKWIEK